MTDTELADLAEVLLIAGGLGLSLACAYLVRKPAQRTFRIWVGAAAVGIPGFLVGLALSNPELGVRAAYRELTEGTREVPAVVGFARAASGWREPGSAVREGRDGTSPRSDRRRTGDG